MKKSISLILLLIACSCLSACVMNELKDEKSRIVLEKNQNGVSLEISLTKGKEWTHQFKPGPVVINMLPQIVFWIEDEAGKLVETIYISGATGKFGNHSTKRDLEDKFFKMAIPVWSDKAIKSGHQLPSSDKPYPDAVTGATPHSSFDLDIRTSEFPDQFTLFAEINKSQDYNDYYTEEKTDWIGQPSIIYSVSVEKAEKGRVYVLKPIGRSGLPPEKSGFQGDFQHMDTALELVDKITLVFK